MALYSKEDTKTFFTNIGGVNDVCYFCKKRLSEQYNKNSIPYDEMKDELKKLDRKLISKRIVKIESLGLKRSLKFLFKYLLYPI